MSQKEVDLAGSSSKDKDLSGQESGSDSADSESYRWSRKDQHKDGHFRSFSWDLHHYCIACKVKGKKSSVCTKDNPCPVCSEWSDSQWIEYDYVVSCKQQGKPRKRVRTKSPQKGKGRSKSAPSTSKHTAGQKSSSSRDADAHLSTNPIPPFSLPPGHPMSGWPGSVGGAQVWGAGPQPPMGRGGPNTLGNQGTSGPHTVPYGWQGPPPSAFAASPWQNWPFVQQGVWGPPQVHPAPHGQNAPTQVSGGQVYPGQGAGSGGLVSPSVPSVPSVTSVPSVHTEPTKAKRHKNGQNVSHWNTCKHGYKLRTHLDSKT